MPPEYRTWGAPEGIEIVDALMRHVRTDYYVGWLSAAAIHGAAHHAPQLFQVAVARATRDRVVGRTSFEFFTRSRTTVMPTISKETRSGAAKVSSAEATALDLAASPYIAGGMDTSATVLIELSDDQKLPPENLIALADFFPSAAVRRLGWILTTFSGRDDLEELCAHTAASGAAPSKLDATLPSRGPIDKAWSLIINTQVVPDV
ncbi:MAG TPA: type IV toxin-antitoxin system AbiEi family antitoxin [Trueperaceae bacterium]|nr:type IV toxin-antitoxin system AbiEi family antitoxin [Trueperaceae bacterium]